MNKKLALAISLCMINGYAHGYYEERHCAHSAGQEGADSNYFMGRFDRNCDNVVTKDEFLALAADRFKYMDIDGNKTIDMKEFLQRYTDFQAAKAAPGQKLKAPDPEKVFIKLDADGDKNITQTEYSDSRNKWFAQLDKNSDGKVSIEETGH